MFTSLFVMSLVSSAVAKITDVMMYNYKLLEDDWDHSVASCPSGSSETHPDENEHKTCTQFKDISGLTCYKDCKCQSDYIDVNNDGVCVSKDCSAYLLKNCDTYRGIFKTCPADSSRCRYSSCKNGFSLDEGNNCICKGVGSIPYSNGSVTVACICNTSDGYEGIPPNCTATACTGDYSATVTSCDTGYTLDCKGYSGGDECCKCTCTANATCTAANYPLESKPSNANYKECTPGCGDNTKRYAITSCKDGYELSGNACVAKQPEGFQCCISDNNSSSSYNQFSLIGRYNSAKDQYDGCESGGFHYEIQDIGWTNGHADMCGSMLCDYYYAEDYDTFKDWLDRASTSLNIFTMVMGIGDNIEADEDIIVENNHFTVQLMPSPVEYGETPKNHTISSLNNSIELEQSSSSVSINYSTPVLIINNWVSLYNSLIKADKIYLKGKVFFDNVKIEPLYSDHVDIYVGSNDEEGFDCYADSYLGKVDEYNDAEVCAPEIGFYSSNPGYQYRRYESPNGYYYWAGSTQPTYSNVWGTPDKPVIFHKETNNTLDGIMFSESTEGVTIYGYNGDSSPVFSEFVIRNYVNSGYSLPTYQFNLKNYASHTVSPLFRRFQTGAPNNEVNTAWRGYAELNIYKDLVTSSSDNTKVTSAVNEIKNNSYLTSGETCSLGTASSYVYARDYDTSVCKKLSCPTGTYDETSGLVSGWRAECDPNYSDYNGDQEYCDPFEKEELGRFTRIPTACDGQVWTDDIDGTEKTWNNCYKLSYGYCMDEDDAEYGICSGNIYDYEIDWGYEPYENSVKDIRCMQITSADNPSDICQSYADEYAEEYDLSSDWYIDFTAVTYDTRDYLYNRDGSSNGNGKKCLVCKFHGTYPNQ